MNSVQTAVTFGIYRANVTAWDDGSIMVEVDGKPVTVDNVGVVAAAVRWSALDRVECRIVTEVPAQEVIDRAAAAVEQARLQVETEAAVRAEAIAVPVELAARGMSVELAAEALAVVATVAETDTCPQCGAAGVKVAQVGTAVACGGCLTLALQAVQ